MTAVVKADEFLRGDLSTQRQHIQLEEEVKVDPELLVALQLAGEIKASPHLMDMVLSLQIFRELQNAPQPLGPPPGLEDVPTREESAIVNTVRLLLARQAAGGGVPQSLGASCLASEVGLRTPLKLPVQRAAYAAGEDWQLRPTAAMDHTQFLKAGTQSPPKLPVQRAAYPSDLAPWQSNSPSVGIAQNLGMPRAGGSLTPAYTAPHPVLATPEDAGAVEQRPAPSEQAASEALEENELGSQGPPAGQQADHRQLTLVLAYFPRAATEADLCEALDRALRATTCVRRCRIVRDEQGHGCYGFFEFADAAITTAALEACHKGRVRLDDATGHTWHVRASRSRRATVGNSTTGARRRRRGREHHQRGQRSGGAAATGSQGMQEDERILREQSS